LWNFFPKKLGQSACGIGNSARTFGEIWLHFGIDIKNGQQLRISTAADVVGDGNRTAGSAAEQ